MSQLAYWLKESNLKGNLMEKLLTIAIPTYNRAQMLEKALLAIEKQYDECVEVLVCDDVSSDNTQEIVVNMQKKLPIHYIRNEVNLGYERNFLQCYRRANGKYVFLMSDHDFIIDLQHIIQYINNGDNLDWIRLAVAGMFDEGDVLSKIRQIDESRYHDRYRVSKYELINHERFGITSNANIVRIDGVSDFSIFEKYFGIDLMQTCIPFELTRSSEAKLGIIEMPCFGTCRIQSKDRWVYRQHLTYFKIFCTGLRKLFLEIAPDCGYDRHQMEKLYKRGLLNMAHPIAYMNANNLPGWKEAFWKEAYPAIKMYALAWFIPIPIAIAPRWFARFVLSYVYPFFHGALIKIREQKRNKDLSRLCD